MTGRQGDLLDLIRIEGKHHNDLAATMAAGSAFLETEREARRQLAAALSLYAGAFCRRFLSQSVRTVHRPGVLTVRGQKGSLTVRLSGPERGTWTHETTGRQGDLLDLIRIEGKHDDDMTGTMAAAHAFLHGEAQAALRHDWKAHDERALAAGNPLYQALVQSSSGLVNSLRWMG